MTKSQLEAYGANIADEVCGGDDDYRVMHYAGFSAALELLWPVVEGITTIPHNNYCQIWELHIKRCNCEKTALADLEAKVRGGADE